MLTLAPLFVISGAFDGKDAILPVLTMPVFVVGLLLASSSVVLPYLYRIPRQLV
ncbi:hypothetical protein H8S59_24360 [Pseudomonas sp. DOAB1069]|uniref:AcrB/AcrD/AcrF family protein n=1 Tax=Pseudomonas folii TaxID=2762593 RepID=A0ABR7B6X1_9PSED|nr:hypothetical protein [Pseudomonas folii]